MSLCKHKVRLPFKDGLRPGWNLSICSSYGPNLSGNQLASTWFNHSPSHRAESEPDLQTTCQSPSLLGQKPQVRYDLGPDNGFRARKGYSTRACLSLVIGGLRDIGSKSTCPYGVQYTVQYCRAFLGETARQG